MRRTGLLFAGALLAASAAVVSPASAHTGGVCAGAAARLELGQGLYYPVVGPTVQSSGFVTTNVGPSCSASVTLTAGNCGNSVGFGTLVDSNGDAHGFSLVTAGSVVVVSGGANGVLNATPDVLGGESCVPSAGNNGANVFLVTGSVVTV